MKGVAPPEASRAKARELIAVFDDWAARGGAPKPQRSRRTAAQVNADRVLERVYRGAGLSEQEMNNARVTATYEDFLRHDLVIVAWVSYVPRVAQDGLRMDRRNFMTLAVGVLCLSSGTALSAILPLEVGSDEPFPISHEEYEKVDAKYLPQLVSYETDEPSGTLIVDPDNRFLYLVLGNGRAKRYGIGVGREGFGWSGTAVIKRKAKWPLWLPPEDMQARDKEAATWREGMPGGPKNPLGARALYLYQGDTDTLYRIHGTREPRSIGRAVSSGCIRMLNSDIIELYERVPIGTRVVVLPRGKTPVANNEQTRSTKHRKDALRADLSPQADDPEGSRHSENAGSIFELFGAGEEGD